MTIKEFIEELKKYPENCEIKKAWEAGEADFDPQDIAYGFDEKEKKLVI